MSGDRRPVTLFDSGATLAERFRSHAGTSTTLYGYAMRAMADDWEAGGPVRAVCAGHEHDPEGSALQLRLLAGLFRVVLTGRAPELALFYPCLGGTSPPDRAWPVMRQVIAGHVHELQHALEVAPQTNEVGRSAALLAGLFDLVGAAAASRVVLLELGASAGLNLLVEHYRLSGPGWSWGDVNSPVQLADAIVGPVQPRPLEIVGRSGCDLHPVDVTTAAGRLLLTSFVWPFDLHRHHRLAAALQIAQRHRPVVDQASAGAWLDRQLTGSCRRPGQLVVVWQSITSLYWRTDEIRRVQQVLDDHGGRQPLGRVALEFDTAEPRSEPALTTTLWVGRNASPVRHRLLGSAHHHGLPVRLNEP